MVEANDRASAWLASHGYVEEALRHALEGGEPLVAARIIEQNAHLPQNHEDPRRLEGWLSLLPAQLLSTRPALVAARASVLTFEGQYQLIPVLLEQAEALLDAASDEEDAESANVVQGQILAYWSNLCVLAGDSARAEDCARRALDLLPPEWQWARGHALAFQCIALHMSGQGELAANLLSQAEAASVGRTDAFTISLPYARCWIHLFAGELGKLLEEAQRLLLQTLQHCCPIARGWGHFFLGFVHYQWNELDMAASNFAEGSGVTDAAHGFQVSMCIVGSAIVSLAQGHFDEARQYLERLAELDHEQGMDTAVERSALRARVALAQNDKESAIQWSLAYQVSPARSAMIHLESLHLSRARILIAEGPRPAWPRPWSYWRLFWGLRKRCTMPGVRLRYAPCRRWLSTHSGGVKTHWACSSVRWSRAAWGLHPHVRGPGTPNGRAVAGVGRAPYGTGLRRAYSGRFSTHFGIARRTRGQDQTRAGSEQSPH